MMESTFERSDKLINEWLGLNMDLTGEDDDEYVPTPQDEHIREATSYKKVKIRIVGCGGAGSNTIDRLYSRKLEGVDLLAVNTDARHLMKIKSQAKLLIGKRRTRGIGSGGIPRLGEEAALEDISQIRELLKGTDIAFVTCGLGGGTGTGAAPIVAKVAKESGATVISIVTLPFSSEGKIRMGNAISWLPRLREYSNTLIAIPNDNLLKESPHKSLEKSFEYSDSVLTETMQGLVEIVRRTGLINTDYADVKNIMKVGGAAMVGIGESDDEPYERVKKAVEQALSFPLIEADVSESKACIVRVIGGKDATLKEAEKAVEEIAKRIDRNAKIKFGVSVDASKTGRIRILVLLMGIRSPYAISNNEDVESLGKKFGVFNKEIDIDHIN